MALDWRGDQVHLDFRGELQARLRRSADVLVRAIRKEAPVKTGRLRDSVQVLDVHGLSATVGAEAPYAGYVDQGTTREAPNNYFERGIDNAKTAVADTLGKS